MIASGKAPTPHGAADVVLSEEGSRCFRDDPCGALYAAAQAHPGETIRLRLGQERLLVVQSGAGSERVLRANPRNYRKNFGSFVQVFGESRFTADGETWERLKAVSQPAIAGRNADRIAATTRRFYGKAADALLSGSTAEIRIDRPLDRAAAGVVLDVAFGLDVDALPDRFFDDLQSALRYCASATWSLGGAGSADLAERLEARDAWARAREDLGALLLGGARTADTGLLDRLFNDPATADNMMGEAVNLLFAGSETTAAAMGWLLFLLATHQELQQTLRDDILRIVGDGPAGPTEASSVPGLFAFINEGLRIFPPVPILSRIAVEADELSGVVVKPGDKILISVIGLHHDATVWASPATLQPSRFQGAAPRAEQRRNFLPFSDGPRVCGGMRFAMIELAVALITMLQRADFRPPSDHTIHFSWSASLRRAGGHKFPVVAA